MTVASPELVHWLHTTHGLDLAAYDETFLAQALAHRPRSTPLTLDRLRSDPSLVAELRTLLGVGYSAFFRDAVSFALLEQAVLPALVDARSRSRRAELRIWSAGCSTGEEAYSVALLLEALAATFEHDVPYRIFGTDRREAAIASARSGVFTRESADNVRLGQLERYFTKAGEQFAVTPRVSERVGFSVHDFLDPGTSCPPASIYGDFDLVLCCNVLIYYGAAARRRVIAKLGECLSKGGFLMVGEAERALIAETGRFRAVAPHAAIFQRRA